MSGTGSKPGRGRKPKAPLSPGEQALWDHAARTMKPLRKAKARVLARAGEVDEFAAAVADVVPKRRVKVETVTVRTHNPRIYAGGDCVNGGKEAVNAVADGKHAARAIHAQLVNQKSPETP